MTAGRIEKRFASLKDQGRAAFIPFITAGDPGLEASFELMCRLPEAGADLIELGMPFTDPMADGPAIQAASLRALKAGASVKTTLDLVRRFRERDADTPIVLMGYFNPIFAYGRDDFLRDAHAAGVDGLIVVDLPPEEDTELCLPAREAGLHFIRLATPTTDEKRLPTVVKNTGGFMYYVSIAGITGTRSAAGGDLQGALHRLRAHTDLPIAVGFGIKTAEKAAEVARIADAVVVGSAIVERIAQLSNDADPDLTERVVAFVSELAKAAHTARAGDRQTG